MAFTPSARLVRAASRFLFARLGIFCGRHVPIT
jgi:hypothetical protein